MASLACAFEDFDDGPGRQFLARVGQLVHEIVEGDFDQIDLYAAKLAELERFIAEQTEGGVEQSGAVTTLASKESELLVQQRYMQQLQAALAPIDLPAYLGELKEEAEQKRRKVNRAPARPDRAAPARPPASRSSWSARWCAATAAASAAEAAAASPAGLVRP